MSKFTVISDTHTYHDKVKIEETDVLIHCGDYCFNARVNEVKSFFNWFSQQPAKYKIFIEGNHDGLNETEPSLYKELLKEYPDLIHLQHESITIYDIKIYGSPTTPEYGPWYHMAPRDSAEMINIVSLIPLDTDVLVTHGPPYGHLDRTLRGENIGCQDLLNRVVQVQPSYHIFGHNHADGGQTLNNGGTIFINAAILDEQYKVANRPVIFEFKP